MSSWLQIFLPRPRFFLPYTDGDQHCEPVDPGVSWIGPTAFVVGLNPEVELPRFIQLHSHRRGRVFRWTTANQVVRVLAFFPSHPAHDRVPPCPGFSPEGFTSWAHPVTAFMDGSQGAWDFRFYPQLFDPCRPWRGLAPFFPQLGTSLDSSIPNRLERWSIMDFWRWNDTRSSSNGGYWLGSRLRNAFERRGEVEKNVEKIYASCKEYVTFNNYILPCYDPLQLSDALQWRTLREGREALSRMLIYVAELGAFSEWMLIEAEQIRARQQGQWPPSSPPPPPSSSYMGVWAQTIQTEEDWYRLSYAGIPIYVAMEVLPNHSLYKIAVNGAPDADERYRHNAFDASLCRQSVRNIIKVWRIPETSVQYATTLTSPQGLLPDSVSFPTRCELTKEPKPSPTAWFYSYTSYLYQDSAIFRGYLPNSPSETKIREYERRQLAVLHPTQRLLNSFLDPHPILAVLPEGRSRGTTHFLEKTDGCSNFWAEKMISMRHARYRFEYERDHVVIHSSRPFPGRPRSVGRVPSLTVHFEDQDMPNTQRLPDNSTRHYYLKKADIGNIKDHVIWTPEKDEKGFDIITETKMATALHHAAPYIVPAPKQSEPALPSNTARLPSTLFDSYASSATTIADLMPQPTTLEIPEDPRTVYEDTLYETILQLKLVRGPHQERIQRISSLISEQEKMMKEDMAHRFFIREWEHWASKEVIQAELPGSNVIYYPIRVCNWDSSVGYDELLALLDKVTGPLDIIALSLRFEHDGTITSDIGYRYCEDALAAWSALNYLRAGERILEVYPLKGIPHVLWASNSDFSMVRPEVERLEMLHRLLMRESHLSRCGKTDDVEIADCVLQLMRDINAKTGSSYGFGDNDEAYWPPLITALRLNGDTRESNFVQKCIGGDAVQSDSDNSQLSKFHAGRICLKSSISHFDIAQEDPIAEKMTDDPIEEGESRDVKMKTTNEPQKKKNKRSKKNRGAHRRNDDLDPAQARDMNAYERHRIKRAIMNTADRLTICWKGLTLEPFNRDPIRKDTSIVSFYKYLWSWRDQCMDALSAFRGSGAHDFDFAPFESTFGDLGDLCKVYGREYREVMKARSQYEAERRSRQ